MRKKLTPIEKQAVQEFVDNLVTEFPDRVRLTRLFGSRARGEGSEASDLDLLIVVDREDEQMEQKIVGLMTEMATKYGQLVAPLTIEQDELNNLNYQLYRLLREIRRDGIDFWKSPEIGEDGNDFLEKVMEMNLKNKKDGKKLEQMIREHIVKEVGEGKECLQAARVLYDNGLYSHAVSKAYFAMFHLSEALLLTRKIERTKHRKLIGAFHHEFKKSGKIGTEFHNMLERAYKDRQKADYKMVKFSKVDAEKRLEEAKMFVERIEELLTKEGFL